MQGEQLRGGPVVHLDAGDAYLREGRVDSPLVGCHERQRGHRQTPNQTQRVRPLLELEPGRHAPRRVSLKGQCGQRSFDSRLGGVP